MVVAVKEGSYKGWMKADLGILAEKREAKRKGFSSPFEPFD